MSCRCLVILVRWWIVFWREIVKGNINLIIYFRFGNRWRLFWEKGFSREWKVAICKIAITLITLNYLIFLKRYRMWAAGYRIGPKNKQNRILSIQLNTNMLWSFLKRDNNPVKLKPIILIVKLYKVQLMSQEILQNIKKHLPMMILWVSKASDSLMFPLEVVLQNYRKNN